MTTSTHHPGPADYASALIRISPKRIQTQVLHSVRFRPVRSLLLLGVLVLVSLLVLFTLSQMAMVQHTMMTHLGASIAPGMAGTGGAGGQGGGKGGHKSWKSQFNQFKIEPLLVRNAPSVEMNTALATNQRIANQIARIIVSNSLPANHHHHHHHHSTHSNATNSTTTATTVPPTHIHPNSTLHTLEGLKEKLEALVGNLVWTPTKQEVVRRSEGEGVGSVLSDAGGDAGGGGTGGLGNDTRTRVSGGGDGEVGDADDTLGKLPEGRREIEKLVSFPPEDIDKLKEGLWWCVFGVKKCTYSNNASALVCDPSPKSCEELRKFQQRMHNASEQYYYDFMKQVILSHYSDNTHQDSPSSSSSSPTLTKEEKEVLMKYLNTSASLYEPVDLMETLGSKRKESVRERIHSGNLTEDHLRNLPQCPEIPPNLLGRLKVDLNYLEKLSLNEVLEDLDWVLPGGSWSPIEDPIAPCLPRHRVAVVLPYRDRLHHLVMILRWLHPILRRQQLAYTIYVAEQTGNATFNKGSIMNAGYMEAWHRSNAECFIFHDVDLLPEDDRNMYSCSPQPRHLSVGVDTLGYTLPYFFLVGGVFSVRGDQFLHLNGYSNLYWGWGGEDDDMGYRIKQSGLSITRPPDKVARYTMIQHTKRKPLTWKVRGKLLRTSSRRYKLDGLNTLNYTLEAIHKHPLFTHLLLDVGTPPENLIRLDKAQ